MGAGQDRREYQDHPRRLVHAKNEKGETVNRTDAIASVGSAAMDNEECYVYQKFLRGLGLVYIEHQARI